MSFPLKTGNSGTCLKDKVVHGDDLRVNGFVAESHTAASPLRRLRLFRIVYEGIKNFILLWIYIIAKQRKLWWKLTPQHLQVDSLKTTGFKGSLNA